MRYLKRLLVVFLLFMGFSAATTYVIDPYRIFFSQEIPGLNLKKPRAEGEIFFNRAVGIESVLPKTLLLGNSRILWGMSAGSALWPANDKPVYNAGIPGSNLATARAYLRHAIEIGGVEKVVLGLDFFSSLVRVSVDPAKPIVLGGYESFLKPDTENLDLMREYALRLGSIDGLIDSIMTVAGQQDDFSLNILPNGDNPLHEYRGYVAAKGHNRLFRDYAASIKIRLARKEQVFLTATDSSPEFEALKEILALSESAGVRLQLFFHPYHSTLHDSIRAAGRYEEYKKWKQRIYEMVNKSNNVDLWDFDVLNAWTTEAVPPPGDVTSNMQWYWEPGHYKQSLGDQMIQRLLKPDEWRPGDRFARLLHNG